MEQTLPAVEGPLERQVRPHVWVVEWGAIALPLGDPSRVTCKSTWDTFEEAEEALFQANKEFSAHMFQAVPVHGGGMPAAYRCIAPLCEPLGCRACNCAVPADVYAVLMRAERADLGEAAARDQLQRTNLALLADELRETTAKLNHLRQAASELMAHLQAVNCWTREEEPYMQALELALGPNVEVTGPRRRDHA